jgi:Fe-S oxidoreductase
MALKEVTEHPVDNEAFYESLFRVTNGDHIRTCLQCASCSGICPFGYLMDFPPGQMIARLRAGLFKDVMTTDTVWLCVSCYACTEVCPAQIPLTPGLMTRAKEELLLLGKVPQELQEALINSQRYGNPQGESPRKRADWTQSLPFEVPVMRKARRPVDVLWFVGDFASYHPRVRQVSIDVARVLHALNVDFGILGPEEHSDGDSQRLAGERGLFELLAIKNGQALRRYEFNQIFTTDPHAYNAFKNEYPKLGISYPVRHYTEFLAERLDDLQPLLAGNGNMRVVYHDPCYLGRANRIYEQPRRILEAIPGVELVEMPHNRQTSLCCGGGGGGMWLDGFQWQKAQARMSDWRVQEALQTGAEVLAIACPYEAPRFEDSTRVVPGAAALKVKDIAELLAEAVDWKGVEP